MTERVLRKIRMESIQRRKVKDKGGQCTDKKMSDISSPNNTRFLRNQSTHVPERAKVCCHCTKCYCQMKERERGRGRGQFLNTLRDLA